MNSINILKVLIEYLLGKDTILEIETHFERFIVFLNMTNFV